MIDDLRGLASAGPDRLTAAGNSGISQIVVPGSADILNFLSPETVPPRYRHRTIFPHNPQAYSVRTNIRDNRKLGKTLADKNSTNPGVRSLSCGLTGGFPPWAKREGLSGTRMRTRPSLRRLKYILTPAYP